MMVTAVKVFNDNQKKMHHMLTVRQAFVYNAAQFYIFYLHLTEFYL